LLAALVVVAVSGALGGSVATKLKPFGFDDPSSPSVAARHLLEKATGADPANALVAEIRVHVASKAQALVATVQPLIEQDPDVAQVTWPRAFSRDGSTTYVVAFFRPIGDEARLKAVERIQKALAGQREVALGGFAVAVQEISATVSKDLRRAELIAFVLLFLFSLWIFGGLVAAALPPLTGAISIIVTFLLLRAVNGVVGVSVYALNMVTALGLGLAIDWSLLILSRYREELVDREPEEAIRRTLATAGRTVAFSAVTVAGSMASLLIFPQRFLYSLGLGGVLVCLVDAATALVVLPALLQVLGPRVDALGLRRWRTRAGRDAVVHSGTWYRLSRFVMRRPARIALASAAVLILIGFPSHRVVLAATGADVLPSTASARQVGGVLESAFRLNRTEPTYLAISAPAGTRTQRLLLAFGGRLRKLPGAAAVSAPMYVGKRTWRIDVTSTTPATSGSSLALVRAIRRAPAPFATFVGGESASTLDQKDSLFGHSLPALLIVLLVTVAALFVMTGSIVLPLKAVVMNTLTLGAAFGILVLVFQDGRFQSLLGYTARGGLNVTDPPLLFALIFGLSTDYGVFLLSRIKEIRDRGADDGDSVALGLERTGRIVTAAAALFCVTMLAFTTSHIVFIKEFGIGAAAAVLVDATIVRALLVPSLMQLLGRWNWWAPGLLRRLHARIGITEA
jgi:uncharacterized membrane protein YdfJ with MMPL/SSD domain